MFGSHFAYSNIKLGLKLHINFFFTVPSALFAFFYITPQNIYIYISASF